MDEVDDYPHWEDLLPDALGLIIKKLPLQEILTVIPRVCKSWTRAVQGPYCWQKIDIYEWSTECVPEQLDRMLRLLIGRSCGSLRELHVACVNDDRLFSFIAEHASSLQKLILRRSEISDAIVTEFAGKFSSLSSLDLSYCYEIRTKALEAIGRSCKSLVSLSWNMHPIVFEDRPSYVDEAHAIANTMPKLKHLELAYVHIDVGSVLDILSGCRDLELLDLRGCWDVELDKKFFEEKHPKVKILGPHVDMGYLERGCWDYASDFSDDYWMDSSDDEFYGDYYYSDDNYDPEDDIIDDNGTERGYTGPRYDGMWSAEDLLALRFHHEMDGDLQVWPASP
ncbi:hypothetical protein Drorol1_Dr00000326 [Drosera rotundifolia]